jgi:hypothetical protein
MKIDNIKEEVTQDMKNLRKNKETEMQNKMEGQSSRTEKQKTELEDEMAIKGKTEELLNNSRPVKSKYKNSMTQSKHQIENHGH